MRNHPIDNLEFALIADGVPADKLYPIDMDRAFKKLDEIKPHVTVWWTTGQQPAQLLLDKEVVLATGWNGRFYDLMKKGAPIAVDWNEGSLKQGTFVIPKGAKDPVLGQQDAGLHERSQAAGDLRQRARLSRPQSREHQVHRCEGDAAHADHPENLPKQFWLSVAWCEDDNMEKSMERWKQWLLKEGKDADLRVDGVAKRYGAVVALGGVSLSVAAGEFLTILGPSGSGKTTLLKVVAGFEFPDAGRCRRRRRHHRCLAGQAQHRHGVPELRAVSRT